MGTITAGIATSSATARPRLQVLPGGAVDGQERRDGVPRVVRQRGGAARQRRTASAPGASATVVRVPRPEVRPRLRLTRRGRLVVRSAVIGLTVLVALVLVLVLSRPASAGAQRHVVPVRYHVVLPGETLWGIAGELAPQADRRELIAQIVELNALPDSGVGAGQRIALPPTS